MSGRCRWRRSTSSSWPGYGRSFPRLVLVRIEEASGGNPFYALEIARSLAGSATAPTPGEPLAHPRDARRADRGPDRRPPGGHPGGAPAGRRGDRADARHAPSRRPRRARGPAAGGRGRDRVDGSRIDPVRASAAGPGRDRDGEPVRAAGRPRGPRPHRDIRRRASPPPGRRHGGSRRDRRGGARGGRGQRPATRRDARRRIALRTGKPADPGRASPTT